MRNIALHKLIRYGNASSDPSLIRYHSIAEFLRKNPDCCALREVAEPEALTWNVELTILFRREQGGPAPFFQQTVQFGPKLENMEESGRPLTPDTYRLFLTHPDGQQVR